MDNQKAASKVCREGLSNVPRGSEDYKVRPTLAEHVSVYRLKGLMCIDPR